jgi:hypothetical protein
LRQHCLNCDPSFCRQAADLVRVPDLGFPMAPIGSILTLCFCAQAVDLVRVSHIVLLRGICWLDSGPLGGPFDLIVSFFCVRRLRTCCVYLILGLPGALIDSILAMVYVRRLRTWCVYLILGLPGVSLTQSGPLVYVRRLCTCSVHLISGFPGAPIGSALAH